MLHKDIREFANRVQELEEENSLLRARTRVQLLVGGWAVFGERHGRESGVIDKQDVAFLLVLAMMGDVSIILGLAVILTGNFA